MDRDRALPLVLAVLAILALAVAAATLDSAVVSEGDSGLGGGLSGLGDEDPGNVSERNANTSANETAIAPIPVQVCFPFLQQTGALAAVGLCFVGLFAVVYRQTRSVVAGALVCGLVLGPVALLWSGLAYCPPPPEGNESDARSPAAQNASEPPAGGSGGFGEGGAETLSSPTVLVALLVAIAIVVLLVALLTAGHDEGGTDDEPAGAAESDAAATIGRVAGTAADRIDAEGDVDAENEVYRAWREMTGSLDVDSPETTTPREFERAAVAAGMDPADVAALTSLFESVRYGGREPTDDHEQRAVETLRRIEAGYGGD